MCRKVILQSALLLIFSISLVSEIGAQQRRAAIGNLLIKSPSSKIDPIFIPIPVRSHAQFRSVNGTNNNIGNTAKQTWGSTGIPLFREIPAQYGPTDPKNAIGGTKRPTPRKISNVVVDEPVTTFNERGLSAFVYVWGQFLDHDMSATPTDTIEYVPIALPSDETIFTEAIPFYRSKVYNGTGVSNVRQQMNLNTAWIDGSMIYGAEATRAKWLRTFKNGKMKMSAGNLLPYNTVTGEKDGAIDPGAPSMDNDGGHTTITFVAGDSRAAEHPGITSLHSLFLREHNRLCDSLVKVGYRNDEQIYQLARKQVGALVQAITYQEFLPAIGITLRSYRGYNDDVRPDILNTFATAGYRIGHTMVADDIFLINDNCSEASPALDLIDAFFDPDLVPEHGLEPFLKGFAVHTQYETDTKINSILRNFLFTSPNDPTRFGIDLGSLNIQRGRDHGLPDYNTVRKFYTGRAATKFSDITSNDTLAQKLKDLYGNVNNIDVWIGLLAEDHLPNKSVGKTMHELLRSQFEKLRDGDFYYYLNDPFLSSRVRTDVIHTKFSDVLKRNTKLTSLQSNVFFTQACPGETGEDLAEAKVSIEALPTFRVYPNPAHELLNIELGSANEATTVKLFNSAGTLLKTIQLGAGQNRTQLATGNLANGVYLINIANGSTTRVVKFVKM